MGDPRYRRRFVLWIARALRVPIFQWPMPVRVLPYISSTFMATYCAFCMRSSHPIVDRTPTGPICSACADAAKAHA